MRPWVLGEKANNLETGQGTHYSTLAAAASHTALTFPLVEGSFQPSLAEHNTADLDASLFTQHIAVESLLRPVPDLLRSTLYWSWHKQYQQLDWISNQIRDIAAKKFTWELIIIFLNREQGLCRIQHSRPQEKHEEIRASRKQPTKNARKAPSYYYSISNDFLLRLFSKKARFVIAYVTNSNHYKSFHSNEIHEWSEGQIWFIKTSFNYCKQNGLFSWNHINCKKTKTELNPKCVLFLVI